MNYLTKLEKIVAVLICAIIAVMCVKLLNTLDPLEAVWIIPASVVVMLFVIVLLLAVNDERKNRHNLDDYNTLRKTLIIEKNENLLENEGSLMICSSFNKDPNRPVCRDCRHAHLHIKTPECDLFDCNHVSKFIGSWREE